MRPVLAAVEVNITSLPASRSGVSTIEMGMVAAYGEGAGGALMHCFLVKQKGKKRGKQQNFFCLCWFPCYSDLSAISGSTFIARRAGILQAASATSDSIIATAAKVIGSFALTP